MDTPITPADIQKTPACITIPVTLPSGETACFRPLAPGDAVILGRYFLSLSDETKRRYGPHPFDQATADRLCAEIDPSGTLRMIATLGAGEQVIAYFILLLGVTDGDTTHYARNGIALDPLTDCTLAPSVADAYQSQGVGSRLLPELKRIARRLGRRRMVLMWGVQATNSRAVHFYEKHGFRFIAPFEDPPGRMNNDMILDL